MAKSQVLFVKCYWFSSRLLCQNGRPPGPTRMRRLWTLALRNQIKRDRMKQGMDMYPKHSVGQLQNSLHDRVLDIVFVVLCVCLIFFHFLTAGNRHELQCRKKFVKRTIGVCLSCLHAHYLEMKRTWGKLLHCRSRSTGQGKLSQLCNAADTYHHHPEFWFWLIEQVTMLLSMNCLTWFVSKIPENAKNIQVCCVFRKLSLYNFPKTLLERSERQRSTYFVNFMMASHKPMFLIFVSISASAG